MRTKFITFDIVDITCPYNAIFDRNIINKFTAVIHLSYLCMKIPRIGGVLLVLGSQDEALRCKDNTSQRNKHMHIIKEKSKELEGGDNITVAPVEHTKEVPLCKDVPDRAIILGIELKESEEAWLIQLLRNNQDIFAWSSA